LNGAAGGCHTKILNHPGKSVHHGGTEDTEKSEIE
jgi:hypothetical protein